MEPLSFVDGDGPLAAGPALSRDARGHDHQPLLFSQLPVASVFLELGWGREYVY